MAPSFKRWEWAIVDLQHLRWKESDSFEHPTRFQPCPEEIQYCIRLNDWWQDIYKQYKEENANVIVHNLADMTGGMSVFARKQGREHRLIQDASPEAPPQGYFDCTVEVGLKYNSYSTSFLTLFVIRSFTNTKITGLIRLVYMSQTTLETKWSRSNSLTGALPISPTRSCKSRCGTLRGKKP